MKKYQHTLLFFAFGIAFVAFVLGFVFQQKNTEERIENEQIYKTTTVNIYFPNSKEDPGSLYCDHTYPSEREITSKNMINNGKTGELAYLAISELLNGPTESEKKAGFLTSLNTGIEVKEISIINETATINFNETLNKEVAGSCRALSIRSQIENTLKQFEEIKKVIILMDGIEEGILEP